MRSYPKLILLAVIFCNGFFACHSPAREDKKAEDLKVEQPFDCASSEKVPLGYIDTSWTYVNKPLGFRFKYPKGWNAMDDIRLQSPTFVPVGGNYYEFRESYLKPRSSSLAVMKNDGFNEPRFLFGFTHMVQPEYDENAMPEFADSVYMAAYLCYTEFADEKAFLQQLDQDMREEWQRNDMRQMLKANIPGKSAMHEQAIGGSSFYVTDINFPTGKSILKTQVAVKKLNCLWLLLYYRWYTKEEHDAILQGLQGLQLSN